MYLARDPVLNRRVAIKFPRWQRLTSEQAARFEREARVTGRLDHPGIIPVHAIRTDSADRPCYVMRFVDGQTLQSRIQKLHAEGPPVKPAVFFETQEFRQQLQNVIAVCNIVAYAHEQGVIHRDIKPANIFLVRLVRCCCWTGDLPKSPENQRTILGRYHRMRVTLTLWRHGTAR